MNLRLAFIVFATLSITAIAADDATAVAVSTSPNGFTFSGVMIEKDAEGNVISKKDIDASSNIAQVFNAALSGASGSSGDAVLSVDLGNGSANPKVDLNMNAADGANDGGVSAAPLPSAEVVTSPNGVTYKYSFSGSSSGNGNKFVGSFNLGKIVGDFVSGKLADLAKNMAGSSAPSAAPSAAPTLAIAPSCVVSRLEAVEKSCGSSVMQLSTSTCASAQYSTVCGSCMSALMAQDATGCPEYAAIKSAVTVSCTVCHSFGTPMTCGLHSSTCQWSTASSECCAVQAA